jgi:hypothetical protein
MILMSGKVSRGTKLRVTLTSEVKIVAYGIVQEKVSIFLISYFSAFILFSMHMGREDIRQLYLQMLI